jgi:hypothetical protein
MEMGFVLVFFNGIDLGLDLVGVEPEHQVGHENHLSS